MSLLDIGRNDPCWCGSRRKYKRCHGDWSPRHPVGAPLPEDPPGKLWLAPDTLIDAEALVHSADHGPPLVLPDERPRARREPVDQITARVAAAQPMSSVELIDLAHLRDDLLATYGLVEGVDLNERVAEIQPSDMDDLRYGILQLARSTLERLAQLDESQDPPAVVRSESIPSAELVGRTMLWADHYLIPDRLAEALTLEDPKSVLANAVAAWQEERRLALLGIVVPTFDRLAVALTGHAVEKAAQLALDDARILSWVRSQLVVHGPSAREVIFIEARDDIERQPYMFFYGHIDPEGVDHGRSGDGTFGMRMLQPYDSSFNYQPWIDQETANVAGRLVQDVAREAVVSEALGGFYVTNSLFRARLLDRLGAGSPVGATMWAEVPALPEADVELLAKIASQQEPVAALRRTVRRTLASLERAESESQVHAVREMVAELEARSLDLEARIRQDRAWERVHAALSGGAIALGGAFGGAVGAAPGMLAAAGLLSRSTRQELRFRRRDAYVFWLAERSLKPRR